MTAESTPAGTGRTPEGLPIREPNVAGGGVPDLLGGFGFRLSGTFYRLRWPAETYSWFDHARGREETYAALVRSMDGFILKHLTEHGRTLWVLNRNEGRISLDQMYEVVYWLDPNSRPQQPTNRRQRRARRNR